MAETEIKQMLNTVLVMQAEILGRLEALEQALESTGDPAQDLLERNAGLRHAPTYEDPRLEALHQIREAVEEGANAGLDKAIQDIVELTNHHA